ncbi:uncharacterized protein LOC117191740 [Drosophila miranda]|uniref:uncharacterized protein LOC117191740 n=1 Tax=Drosophila miranda TaxID=7229 RepID=UPI00143F76EF|nr:uncharacterized protein LOC117191740 [Drosophila miranda]
MDYENIKFEFREGSRAGCSLLLFSLCEQQIYVKNKHLKLGETTYICRVKLCKARVYLSADKSRVYSNPEYVVHSHGPQSDEMEKISALSEIKLKCENNSNFDTKKVFNDVLAEKTKGEAEIEINYDAVKRTLQRKRQPFLPKPPSSAENVLEAFQDENIMNRFGITKGNTANQHYLIDATFKVCPFGDFKQLLIIYIKYLQKITPFVFVLMTRKTELCYQHLFTYIDSNICCLKGASFISDYEKAMRNALKGLHPNMNFYACWFHFTQACKKNAKQSSGFENTLKCNKKAYMLFMKFLHLPLLPESKIVEAFNLLKGEAINLNKKLFSPFLKYFNRQWLKKEGPKSISVFKRSTRTTSSVEAYNLNLGNKIRGNGHFFKFVQCLIDAEYEKSREFALLFQNGGNGNQTQKKKLRDRSKK